MTTQNTNHVPSQTVAQTAQAVPSAQTVAKVNKPVVTKERVGEMLYRWSNLPSRHASLFLLLAQAENPKALVAEMMEFLGEVRAAARAPQSKDFTFDGKSAEFKGLNGREALNAITDDRPSNGKVRKAIKDTFRA